MLCLFVGQTETSLCVSHNNPNRQKPAKYEDKHTQKANARLTNNNKNGWTEHLIVSDLFQWLVCRAAQIGTQHVIKYQYEDKLSL